MNIKDEKILLLPSVHYNRYHLLIPEGNGTYTYRVLKVDKVNPKLTVMESIQSCGSSISGRLTKKLVSEILQLLNWKISTRSVKVEVCNY